MRLTDADILKDHISELLLVYSGKELANAILNAIDNALTVETDIEVATKDAYDHGYTDGWKDRFGEPEIKDDIIRCQNCKYRVKEWREDKRMKEKGYWQYGCSHFGDMAGYWFFGGSDNEFCSDAKSVDSRGDKE